MSVNVSLTYQEDIQKKDLRNISNNFIDFVNVLDNLGCENVVIGIENIPFHFFFSSAYMPLAHAIAKDAIKENMCSH